MLPQAEDEMRLRARRDGAVLVERPRAAGLVALLVRVGFAAALLGAAPVACIEVRDFQSVSEIPKVQAGFEALRLTRS